MLQTSLSIDSKSALDYLLMYRYKQLLKRHTILSDQMTAPRLQVILRELEGVLDQKVPGAVVEFGCYSGTTSVFIRRLLNDFEESDVRSFVAYDSFEGLPLKHSADQSRVGEQFTAGSLSVSKKQLLTNFARSGLQPPKVIKGWFNELIPAQIPDRIAFAFLDGDFYDSILDSLRLVWPRLTPGGRLTIDDCQREALPGVDSALQTFFGSQMPVMHVEQSIGVIIKS